MPKTFNVNWTNKIAQDKLTIKISPFMNFSFEDNLQMEITSLSPLEDFNLRCSFIRDGFLQAEYLGHCFLGVFHIKKVYIFKKDCVCDCVTLDFDKKIFNLELRISYLG